MKHKKIKIAVRQLFVYKAPKSNSPMDTTPTTVTGTGIII